MNILVIEDEQKVAALLKSGLEEQGYREASKFNDESSASRQLLYKG